ncbi:MAG TPA: hypothetical protein VJH92_05090 [Candidatus Nanoarchaeia archaeon]|nr:hypothetical protein [Candidatus Nanoarchaeia archaeon]
MEIKRDDVGILWAIHQGGSNMYMIREAMGVKISEQDLKHILEKLARMSLIDLRKEYNKRIKDYEWDFSINKDKAKAIFEKYEDWIPGKK